MPYRIAADLLVLAHLAFIVFAVLGALLVLRRPRWALLHLPAAAWACWVEFTGRICPLTPMEVALRQRAGQAGYAGGFVDHYLIPVIYPPGLTPDAQVWIGAGVLALNLGLYTLSWWRLRSPAADNRSGRAPL